MQCTEKINLFPLAHIQFLCGMLHIQILDIIISFGLSELEYRCQSNIGNIRHLMISGFD